MTARRTIEELLEGRQLRRMKQEDRFIEKMDRQTDTAEALIGEVCREGQPVFYINLTTRDGKMTGKTLEGKRADLVGYLIRNNYV